MDWTGRGEGGIQVLGGKGDTTLIDGIGLLGGVLCIIYNSYHSQTLEELRWDCIVGCQKNCKKVFRD